MRKTEEARAVRESRGTARIGRAGSREEGKKAYPTVNPRYFVASMLPALPAVLSAALMKATQQSEQRYCI